MKLSGRAAKALVIAGAGALVAARAARVLRRRDFRGASVVITGGSRGLGLELARAFGLEGARLSLLARDREHLKRAVRELRCRGVDARGFVCDVTVRDEVERTIRAIVSELGRIDVLVNDAGIIQVAPMEQFDLSDYRACFGVYAWGPLFTMRAVIPHMKKQGGGSIVNISSIGGLVSVPHLLPYCMAKFALTALSDGSRAELARHGIRVTTVAPGLMRTGSHLRALFKGQHKKEFAWFALSGALPFLSMTSERAARRIVEACRYGEARVILTVPAKLLHACNALFPGVFSLGTKAAARLLPGPGGRKGGVLRTGRQSRSLLAPALLTRPADRAAQKNNER